MAKNRTNRIFPPIDQRLIWIGLGVITFLLRPLFRMNPQFTEVVYSRGIFVVLRTIWDFTLGWSPFALIYVVVPLLLGLGIWLLIKSIKQPRGSSFLHRMAGALFNLLAFGGGVLFLFYVLWGFNYYRAPVNQRIGLKKLKMSEELIREELSRATKDLLEARAVLYTPDEAAPTQWKQREMESRMRKALTDVLRKEGYTTPGRVRARALYPKGLLMQLGASGIYIPFVFEGHVDAGMPPVTYPSTMVHEMAHGYGFGDEGTCNFWAWLACYQSDDPVIRYGGLLGYWREVAVMYRMIDKDGYMALRADLPSGLIADLESINEAIKKYPGFFPQFSDEVYDSYLKNQGISEGMESYGQVVVWVAAWRERTSI
ncbi:MAG: DUF3810 domain-containing protein [Bacteroidia bacterium]